MDDDEELAALIRAGGMQRGRNEQSRSDDDDGEEEHNERQPLRRESQSASGNVYSRWRLLLRAFVYLTQVFLEIGRRALRMIELNVPRYISFVDRCLVQVIRVSAHPRKKVSVLRLLLTLMVIAAIPYIFVTMYRVQQMSPGSHDSMELTEERIHPVIIVEHIDEPTPTRRQSMLRDGGDGLRPDSTEVSCANTKQGPFLLADSAGYVCTRRQLDQKRRGCCNETDAALPRVKQFTCDRCDTVAPHCCDIYEHCVACCMHPLNMNLRRDYLTHVDQTHPVYQDPTQLTVFEYCAARCRTSSASVHHQNSYRSRRVHCFGLHRPPKLLDTVNSDDSTLANTNQTPLPSETPPATELEWDPFYQPSR